jgi:acetylornithine deacetylase
VTARATAESARLFREARELIEIPSKTGEEARAVDRAEELLSASGLATRSIQVGPGRRNLLAGPPGARVILCTHLDTVPPHVPYREDADFLYGRGSCDAKGIAAAMLEAARRLLSAGIRDFGILFVVGEEVDNAGARAANREVRAESIIVGEPTQNLLARGHKGVINARLHARGTAAHSAYPQRGDSAIHRLLDALQRIRRADFGSHPLLGPATVNVGRIGGGVAQNVLAPEAWAELAFRLVLPLLETEERIARCLRQEGGNAPDPLLRLEIVTRMPPTFTAGLEGFPETVVAFGTDIPYLSDIGTPYLLGPGDILDAHTDGERVSRKELLDAAAIYERMVKRLLEGGRRQ